MPTAIEEGKVPAIKFLDRIWNDVNDGVRINLGSMKQVVFKHYLSLTVSFNT